MKPVSILEVPLELLLRLPRPFLARNSVMGNKKEEAEHENESEGE